MHDKKIVFYFLHGNGYDRKQNSNIFAKEWIIMKIGFIGCGNMATAMLKGILKSGEVAATDMIASAKSDKTRKKIEQELGIQKADTNAQVVDFADVVFLAVKPQFLEGVLDLSLIHI